MRLMEAHSWFPRNKKKFSGYLICKKMQQKGQNPQEPFLLRLACKDRTLTGLPAQPSIM